MKKILLNFTLVLCFGLYASGQEAYKSDSLYLNVRNFFEQIDTNGRQHNLFFNYGFVYSDILEDWFSGVPIISKPELWKLIYHSCIESDLTNQLFIENIDSIVEHNRNSNVLNFSELAFLNYIGDYLSVNSLENIISENFSPEYRTMNIFSGVALKYYLYDNEVEFSFKPQNFYSNFSGIYELEIDFDDGLGFKSLDIKKEQLFNVTYECVGEKSITYRLISYSDTLYSYSSIKIVALDIMIPTISGEVSVEDTTLEGAMFRLCNPNVNLAYANYKYFEGCDNILDRPVIIAEGFDVLGNYTINDLSDKWKNTIETLQLRGYDVFVLNFRSPGRSLITNADIVIKLIKEINENKIGNHEGIFIGESMAGILGRIALRKLENESYDHQIGLYISYDSPHKGASVPVGLQWLVYDVFYSLGPWPFIITGFTDILELIFGIDIPYSDILSSLQSISAQQMLSKHYLGFFHHLVMQNFLSDLGYPNECRKVAFTNGSNIANGLSSSLLGSEMLNSSFISGLYNVSYKAWFSNINTVQNVSRVAALNLIYPWHSFYTTREESFNNYPYEIAPGGHNSGAGINFTFVPTVSAIDIAPHIFMTDFYFYNKNLNIPNDKAHIIANNLSPFDEIYSRSFNTFHLSPISILDLLEKQEIMYDRMYLQNRHINKNRDFTSRDFITVGSNVQPDEFLFNTFETEYQKTIAVGPFSISSGQTVNFRAGEYIYLDNEFETNYANEFNAEINYNNCPPQRIEACRNLSNPLIKGSKYICSGEKYTVVNLCNDNCTIEWLLRGNGIEINEVGNEFVIDKLLPKGQYSITCSMKTNSCKSASSIVVSATNNKICLNDNNQSKDAINAQLNEIILFPNPTDNQVFVSLNNAEVKEVKIELFDVSGRVVLPSKIYNEQIIQLNLGTISKGIYFINITNHDYRVTKKLIIN